MTVCQTASLLCRKELYDLKSVLDGLLYVARICASRCDEDPFFNTVLYDLRVQSRTYDEFRSCCHRAVNLLCCQHCTRAHQHIRELLSHDTDRFLRRVCTECHLRARKTSLAECLSKRLRVFRVIQNNDRNDTDLFDLF